MPTLNAKDGSIRILVADDSKPMREKVVQLLNEDFEVMGTAADGLAENSVVFQYQLSGGVGLNYTFSIRR